MASSTKGRSGRSTYASRSTGWGSASSSTRRLSSSRTTRPGARTGTATGYTAVCNTLQAKISSFKTLYNQARGTGKYSRPTPATLNTFAKWINKGAIIQTVSLAQITKWARAKKKNFNNSNPSVTACKTVLASHFGKPTIKAVARTKSGSFMVVTSATVNGKDFCFPH